MKEQEYVPQFDYDNFDDSVKDSTLKNSRVCKQCGQHSVSLHNGLCIYCRQEADVITQNAEPDKKDKKKFIIGLIVSFVVLLVIIVVLHAIAIENYNSSNVLINALYNALLAFDGVMILGAISGVVSIIVYFAKKPKS